MKARLLTMVVLGGVVFAHLPAAMAATVSVSLPKSGRSAMPPNGGRDYFEHRRALQKRLVDVGYRISAVAASECGSRRASLPVILEQAGQFEPAMLAAAGFAEGDLLPRVVAIAAGSAAAQAGLAQGDALVLWSPDISPADRAPSFANVERAVSALESQGRRATGGPPDQAMTITVVRAGARLEMTVPMDFGCGAWFDLAQSAQVMAASTTRWIQVSEGMMRLFDGDDDGLAFVVAHEFGHRALRLKPGGAEASCSTSCEMDADRLGLMFLRKAGFVIDRAPEALRTIAASRRGFLDWRPAQLRKRAAVLQDLVNRMRDDDSPSERRLTRRSVLSSDSMVGTTQR